MKSIINNDNEFGKNKIKNLNIDDDDVGFLNLPKSRVEKMDDY